jgi:hypothetical protein
MKKFEKNMEEIFDINIEPIEKQTEIITQSNSEIEVDATKDYEYTRGQLYTLISQGQEAVQGALEVAQESGHPRAYEVAVNAMKQVSDMTDKLIDLQQKMKNLGKEDKKSAAINGNVTNNMFFGTTADLQLLLKRGKVEEDK